ncbi:MAG TPA: IS4 family transposase, partial [Ktedonobacteraceae bacterium]
SSVSYLSEQLARLLEERADRVAKDTGCVPRKRKFSGASLLQTLVFGWQQHPDASLEQLASTAAVADVLVTDTAVQKRFTQQAAQFLHAMLEEACSLVVQAAHDVPLPLLRRFSAVILEDSSSLSLPNELAEIWRGCGGKQDHTAAAVKLHVRWELKRGRLWGPKLTDGRASDRRSPLNEEPIERGSLSIKDLGYFNLEHIAQRRRAGAYTLTRWQAGTALFTAKGKKLSLQKVLPQRVGQMKQMRVLVGATARHAMRVLMLKVPKKVGEQRREDLLADAQRRGQPISEETLRLADWTILLTDVPAKRLRFEEALVLLRERWQMELLYKLWKSDGLIDEWRTENPWRVLCELYAKLIGMLLQHWLIVLFDWQDPQRSLVKLAQVVRDSSWVLMDALAGHRSVRSALRLIGRHMRSGCQLNKRKKHPNSAQLLEQEAVEWALSW